MAAARVAQRPDITGRATARPDRGARYAGIVGALVFHGVLIVALLQYAPARRSLAQAVPVVVSLIASPVPVAPPSPPQPTLHRPAPKPTPVAPERSAEPAARASDAVAFSPIAMPSAGPPLLPPTAPVTESDAGTESPPAIVPPRFNADYLRNPAPSYPALARRMREQGRVLVRVLVGVDGAPEHIEIKASSGYPRLDQSALETIRTWRFVPARQGDQTIAAWVLVPITFTLES